jgi:hypothetical protein
MSLQIKKESGVVYDPVFLKILEDIPGGVTIKTNRFPTTTKEIKKGALLNADATSLGLYNVIKTVKATAAGATGVTVIAIEPTDHLFKVGEFIFLYGATASTITRVSATAIAFGTALPTGSAPIASGAVLYEAAAAGASAALYKANAVLRDTIEVRRGGVETLLDNIFAGAVVRGTVDESETPYFASAPDKSNLTARIRFA